MDRDKAFAFAASCYNGEPASCTFACPFRLDLRSFLKKAAKGRWDAAYKELRNAALFPSVIAALCPHPCEAYCQHSTVFGNPPISVGLIEKACLAFSPKKEASSFAIPPKTDRIAVVGAGPAGLSCALLLAQNRFLVTVFDKNEGWGGSLRTHPHFEVFDRDFALQFSAVEAEFRFRTEIRSPDDLTGFQAVLLAAGRGGADFGLLQSWNAELAYTDRDGFFLGGELTGLSLMEGMAQAARSSRSIASFIQSGSSSFAAEEWDRGNRTRAVPHRHAPDAPPVTPAGELYTEAEARSEAARCMSCDCINCMDSCELLIKYKKKPPRISNDVFLDGQTRNSVSSACITRETWSCNLCGRCSSVCHAGADVCGLFQYSRTDRVASGNYPPALHDYWLREMAFSAGEGSLAAAPAGKEGCEYAFFPGCRLGASRPDHVRLSYAYLRKKLDAGLLLNCCGVPAWWAGDESRFQAHLEELRSDWEKLGGPTLIMACATCERIIGRFLPEIPMLSLYEVLKAEGTSPPPFPKAAVFDPCAAADRPSLKESVRKLAAGAGLELTDFDGNGQCCGFGGHMQLADPCLYEEIAENRMAAAEEPYIVYCTNCREVFLSHGKDCAHILDIVFGLPGGGVPTLEEKRENALRVKKELLKEYWDESFDAAQKPWDGLPLEVTPEAQQKMERNLITLGDVRETVWQAERSGEGFVYEDGELLCSLPGPVVTYWVRYRKYTAANGEERMIVTDVYSHRMRIREEV